MYTYGKSIHNRAYLTLPKNFSTDCFVMNTMHNFLKESRLYLLTKKLLFISFRKEITLSLKQHDFQNI